MGISNNCKIELPSWVGPFLENWQEPLATISQRMRLALTHRPQPRMATVIPLAEDSSDVALVADEAGALAEVLAADAGGLRMAGSRQRWTC